ncbi:MAG: BtrH N-terminal domain-containing protein [Anaerolineales bacterium]
MSILSDYTQFDGRHWETGSVHNVFAYQGIEIPETGQPISEAMLMGISGGAAFGYFIFEYEGLDPYVSLLSRNTFDPLDTLLERLAIPQDLFHTADPSKGVRNLIDVIEGGRPAIVWADVFGLPYNSLSYDEQMWAMFPIVVHGYADGEVHIADRSSQSLQITEAELATARARVKKDKYRVLALGAPDLSKLPGAIQKGIWQCIALYTEAPPKGGRDNFGFAAYDKWAKMLTNTRNKRSWARLLAPGSKLFAALAGVGYQQGAFGWARTFPSNQVDDRRLYADFLNEAALILKRPELKVAGEQFIASSNAWLNLSEAALPDEVPLLREAKGLLLLKQDLFLNKGSRALDEITKADARLSEIYSLAAAEFPMSDKEVASMREGLAEHVMNISKVEHEAIELLQAAIA